MQSYLLRPTLRAAAWSVRVSISVEAVPRLLTTSLLSLLAVGTRLAGCVKRYAVRCSWTNGLEDSDADAADLRVPLAPNVEH